MGEKHLFSIEAPYGIDDERVRKVLINRFPLTRNWVSDTDAEFMDGIMRGDKRDPATSTKPYLEWERGPVTATTVDEMKGWVDTSLKTGAWLVLVIHGVDGVGYQPLPTQNVKDYFDYIKASSDRLWIATYQDGAKYIRERMKSGREDDAGRTGDRGDGHAPARSEGLRRPAHRAHDGARRSGPPRRSCKERTRRRSPSRKKRADRTSSTA